MAAGTITYADVRSACCAGIRPNLTIGEAELLIAVGEHALELAEVGTIVGLAPGELEGSDHVPQLRHAVAVVRASLVRALPSSWTAEHTRWHRGNALGERCPHGCDP